MASKKHRKARRDEHKPQVLPEEAESSQHEVASNMPAVACRSANFFNFLQYYQRPELMYPLLKLSNAGTYFIFAPFLPTAPMAFEAVLKKSAPSAADGAFMNAVHAGQLHRPIPLDVAEEFLNSSPEIATNRFGEDGTTGVWFRCGDDLMFTGEGTRNLEELLRKDWSTREPQLKPRPYLNKLQKLNKTDFKDVRPLGSFGNIQLSYVQFTKKEDELQPDLPEFGFMKKVSLKAPARDHLNLMNEALVQEFVAGPHVVKFIGSCYFNGTAIFTEAGLFSLQCCLRANRGKLGQAVKLRWSIEAAEALVHTGQIWLHRNVRSSSFFVTNDFILKLGNFEYADNKFNQSLEYNYDISLTRYLPPETVFDKIYTIESEVWSYGVLVWEIYSEGKEPHAGMRDHEVRLKWMKEGRTCHRNKLFKLKMPWKCPGDVVGMIEQCWSICDCCGVRRPPISVILTELKEAYQKWMED